MSDQWKSQISQACSKSTQNMADRPLQHNMEFLIKLDSTLGKELLHSMTKGEEW